MNRLKVAWEIIRGRAVIFNVEFATFTDMIVGHNLTIQDSAFMQGGAVNGRIMEPGDHGRVRLKPLRVLEARP